MIPGSQPPGAGSVYTWALALLPQGWIQAENALHEDGKEQAGKKGGCPPEKYSRRTGEEDLMLPNRQDGFAVLFIKNFCHGEINGA